MDEKKISDKNEKGTFELKCQKLREHMEQEMVEKLIGIENLKMDRSESKKRGGTKNHDEAEKPEKLEVTSVNRTNDIKQLKEEYRSLHEEMDEIKKDLHIDLADFKKKQAESNAHDNDKTEVCINNIMDAFIENKMGDDIDEIEELDLGDIKRLYEEIKRENKLDPKADISQRSQHLKQVIDLLKDQLLGENKEYIGWDERYMKGE